jgi:hypothetical protein
VISDPTPLPRSRRVANRLGIRWPPSTDYERTVVHAAAVVLEYLEAHRPVMNRSIDTGEHLRETELYQQIQTWTTALDGVYLTSRMRERALQAALGELSSDSP